MIRNALRTSMASALLVIVACGGSAGGTSTEDPTTSRRPSEGAVVTNAAAAPTTSPPIVTEPSTSTSAATTTTGRPPRTSPTTSLVPNLDSIVTTLAVDIEGVTGGVEIGPDGNVYTADFASGRIYRVTLDGDVEVFVDSPMIGGASGNTFGPDGALYQSSFPDGKVFRITLDGAVEEFATGLDGPVGIVSDGADGFFVADCDARRIMAISGSGEVSEFARHPDFNCPNGIARDDDGNVYMANFGDGKVFTVSPDGEAEQLAILRGDNNGHLSYFDDRLYVLARGAHLLYAVDLDGTLSIVAGTGEFGVDDGPGDEATLNLPNDIDIDEQGRIYINQSSAPSTTNNPVAVRIIDLP